MVEFIRARKLKAEKFNIITTEGCFSLETKNYLELFNSNSNKNVLNQSI